MYHRKQMMLVRRRPAMSGTASQPPGPRYPRIPRLSPAQQLGSLGDDTAPADQTTLSTGTLTTPTLADPTLQWQANVLAQLQAGVDTMKMANTQKWLQIIATVSIPLSAVIWKALAPRLFKKGAADL